MAITLLTSTLKAQSFDSLDINNINARINADGTLFHDLDFQIARFEVPNGSGKHTIFNSELWIGGIGGNGNLHVAGQLYGALPGFGYKNFWPGPIMDSSIYADFEDSLWNRVWKVRKSEIDSHKVNWNNPGYVVPQSLVEWPGNGDILKGQAEVLAPFFDRTNDLFYDPADGDYPLIRGDQAIYFIYNDDRKDHLNGGEKMRIEIHGMAYAFDCQSDSALNHTVFVNYQIINRSINTYDSTFVGMNYDSDIGYFDDDYIECDVARGSIFNYNVDSIDGLGAPNHYGLNPPAQSITFLKGPRMPDDGLDNSAILCDESINGSGFNDGIVDNECYGMTHFKQYCNPSCLLPDQSDPISEFDFYNYLRGNWIDGTKLKYGGFGHISFCSSCEDARFMFPANSDSCYWGTGGIAPLDTLEWRDTGPSDKRGLGSMGPFIFNSDDTVEIDIAFVFGRDYADTTGSPYAGVFVMQDRIDSIRSYFEKNATPCGDVFVGYSKQPQIMTRITIYPNPVNELLLIQMNQAGNIVDYEIYNLLGERVPVRSHYIHTADIDNISIPVKHLNKGIYILKLIGDRETYMNKFIKM